jgi:hypothetical protein
MSTQDSAVEVLAVGPGDSGPDFSREEAAYQRERDRLVRDHSGKYALVHGHQVVGVFSSFQDAVAEGGRRFELSEMMVCEITDPEPAAYISHVDVNHPSFHRLT